jgi:hypothetical protein
MSGKKKVTKGQCPECGAERNADIVAEYSKSWDAAGGLVWGRETYRILQCRGCEDVYYQRVSIFSEDEDHRRNEETGEDEPYIPEKLSYWPPPSQWKRPDWMIQLKAKDHSLGQLFGDVYTALDSDLPVLAAIGARTVFDRAAELLRVPSALTFSRKMDELIRIGHVGGSERQALEVLIEAGSAAAHRGWRPSTSELTTMMSILEQFLFRSFLLSGPAKALKRAVPAKKKA